MGNCRKALLIEILIEPFAILRVLDSISFHYLNVTFGAFYSRVHIRYLLIRFIPPYLKYKYDIRRLDARNSRCFRGASFEVNSPVSFCKIMLA